MHRQSVDPAPLHGLIAGCGQHGMVMAHGGGGESLAEPPAVLGVDLMGPELGEHNRPQRRAQSKPHLAPVLLHRGQGPGWFDLIEPGLQQLADRYRRALDTPRTPRTPASPRPCWRPSRNPERHRVTCCALGW